MGWFKKEVYKRIERTESRRGLRNEDKGRDEVKYGGGGGKQNKKETTNLQTPSMRIKKFGRRKVDSGMEEKPVIRRHNKRDEKTRRPFDVCCRKTRKREKTRCGDGNDTTSERGEKAW